MRAILGIDAAWTRNHPSGIALICESGPGEWKRSVVASSYADFFAKCDARPNSKPGEAAFFKDLIQVAEAKSEAHVALVLVDMPLARGSITGRRVADNAVSRCFGAQGCSTHSPNALRPVLVAEELRDGLRECGFELATRGQWPKGPALLETYPHPALLALMSVQKRVPYKVTKTATYWKRCARAVRLQKLIEQFKAIRERLAREIDEIHLDQFENATSFASLKPIEDQIDALVCAWVGIAVLKGDGVAIGDDDASVWVPKNALPFNGWKDFSGYIEFAPYASPEYMDNVVDDPPPSERWIVKESSIEPS